MDYWFLALSDIVWSYSSGVSAHAHQFSYRYNLSGLERPKIYFWSQDKKKMLRKIMLTAKITGLGAELLRVVQTKVILFLKSISERGGSDMQGLDEFLDRLRIDRRFKFRVVICRIRFLPTLISKIKWLGSELPLTAGYIVVHNKYSIKWSLNAIRIWANLNLTFDQRMSRNMDLETSLLVLKSLLAIILKLSFSRIHCKSHIYCNYSATTKLQVKWVQEKI